MVFVDPFFLTITLIFVFILIFANIYFLAHYAHHADAFFGSSTAVKAVLVSLYPLPFIPKSKNCALFSFFQPLSNFFSFCHLWKIFFHRNSDHLFTISLLYRFLATFWVRLKFLCLLLMCKMREKTPTSTCTCSGLSSIWAVFSTSAWLSPTDSSLRKLTRKKITNGVFVQLSRTLSSWWYSSRVCSFPPSPSWSTPTFQLRLLLAPWISEWVPLLMQQRW